MMQQQEEDEVQILMEKEQRAISSTPKGKDLLIIQHALSLHHFLQYSIPQNLGVASKVTIIAYENTFSSRIDYSVYKQYLESPGNATLDVG